MKTNLPIKEKIPSTYNKLMALHAIRPLHDDVSYEKALEIFYALMKIENMNEDQSDYFDLLSEQIEKYERKNYSVDLAENNPIENLRSLLQDHGMSKNDLGRLLGSPELGSRILNGNRELSKRHIEILANYFKLNPGFFFKKPSRKTS